MAESQIPAPAVRQGVAGAAGNPAPDERVPHGEHEVTGKLDEAAKASLASDGNVAVPESDARLEAANGTTYPPADDVAAAAAATRGKTAIGKPSTLSLKPAAGKSNGGPPTPLVKKIINSGTFGAGTVKSTAPRASTASKPAAPSASPIKKAASSSSAPSSKPAMVPKIASSISASLFGSGPGRRASLAPKATTPAAKPADSSPTTEKKPSTVATTATKAPARTSAVSPSSSTTRPRASLTEGIKKFSASGRQSLPASTKVPPISSRPVAAARPARPTGSISSIKEVKEDGKALEELQNTLNEVSSSLAAKAEAITGLEAQVGTLNASLETAVADGKAQRLAVEQLEQAKATSEARLKEATETLEKLRFDYQETSSNLQAVQLELETTRAHASLQTELVQRSQSRIEELESEIKATKENLEVLRAANESAAVAAAAAAIEHDALIKAKADLDAIQAETQTLKTAHAQVIEAAELKLKELEGTTALVIQLLAEVQELKGEKEENASKISELEVEILELKESQDAAEDDRAKALQRIKELENELSKSVAAMQQAVEEAKVRDADGARAVEELKAKHEGDLGAAADTHTALVNRLEALGAQLAEAQAAHEQARVSAEAAAKDHAQKLKELESTNVDKHNVLSEEIKRVTAELESQEVQYSAKVVAVKAEHDKLLQEAFERAKNEAGAAHSNDLQALRAESQATIEQLRSAHESTVESLKAEHHVVLDEQVKTLEQKLDRQTLDLKATQEDLAKAKAALESARSEVVKIQEQLNEARATAEVAAEATPRHLATIDRLTADLSNSKNELVSLTEILNLTKTSLADISKNHTTELEEAAKGRAEEVTKLRAAHDEEMTSLATQKSELVVRLSDLESDLATLKASAAAAADAAAAAALPKSNGNVDGHIPEPGITKEELQQLHEAHNLKMHDLQAEHNREIKALKEELEAALSKADGLQQDVSRRAMEIQYLEEEQEENQDQITRLKEDVEHLTEQFKAKEQSVDE